jgi:hypothetical protein
MPWTISARMNRYQGRHTMKRGGDMRAYYGEAARFEPINLVFNSTLTAQSCDTLGSRYRVSEFRRGPVNDRRRTLVQWPGRP